MPMFVVKYINIGMVWFRDIAINFTCHFLGWYIDRKIMLS